MSNLEIVNAAGEYWLYDTVKGPGDLLKPVNISSTGADIINMIKCGMKRQEIIEKMCDEYGIDAESAGNDFDEFLIGLDKAGYKEIL